MGGKSVRMLSYWGGVWRGRGRGLGAGSVHAVPKRGFEASKPREELRREGGAGGGVRKGAGEIPTATSITRQANRNFTPSRSVHNFSLFIQNVSPISSARFYQPLYLSFSSSSSCYDRYTTNLFHHINTLFLGEIII